jgi:hypothetical protein
MASQTPNDYQHLFSGHAIAQVVSCWPTSYCGGLGAMPVQVMWDLWWTKWHWGRFSEYFGFPLHFSFHRLLHTFHHLLSEAGTVGQIVADVPSGLSVTPHQGGGGNLLFLIFLASWILPILEYNVIQSITM